MVNVNLFFLTHTVRPWLNFTANANHQICGHICLLSFTLINFLLFLCFFSLHVQHCIAISASLPHAFASIWKWKIKNKNADRHNIEHRLWHQRPYGLDAGEQDQTREKKNTECMMQVHSRRLILLLLLFFSWSYANLREFFWTILSKKEEKT